MTLRAALSLLLLSLLLGCNSKSGPSLEQVSGTVTYQGKPLPLGIVMFVPNDRLLPAAVGKIDSTGRYQLQAPAGSHKVQVQMIARLSSDPAPSGEAAAMNIPVVDWLIPEKFADAETSGLAVTVESGKPNEINLPLP